MYTKLWDQAVNIIDGHTGVIWVVATPVLSVDTKTGRDILLPSVGLKWWWAWWQWQWQFSTANTVLCAAHSYYIEYDVCIIYHMAVTVSFPSAAVPHFLPVCIKAIVVRLWSGWGIAMSGPKEKMTWNFEKMFLRAMADSMFLQVCGTHAPDCTVSQPVTKQ